jgi:hypothetical protein
VPAEILVRFRKGTGGASPAQTPTLTLADGRQIALRVKKLGESEVVESLRLAHVAPEETANALGALRSRADVIYAEPNYFRRKTTTPGDPRYGNLWGLKNTGQSFGTPGADFKAEQAWDLTTGKRGIVVAVIDEGIDVNHQDLQANIWRSSGEVAGNSFDDDGNGYVDDVSGYDFFHNDGSVYSNMSLISVGFYHMAAMGPNANLWIWGSNTYGQIGDGSMLQRNAPVPLDFFSTGPTIHYTTNGADPTGDDPVVASGASVLLNQNTVLKARVFREGFAPSTIKSASYQIDINQINDTAFFVRQHYLDFLNREPDALGLQFWINNIDSCGADLQCREVKRIDTSAAYFLSIEFQETGYLVHRFYRASFGRRPLFSEFLADNQAIGNGVVVNEPGWEQVLESNKQAFANSWVTRPAFASVYDGLNNAQYVDTLIANTGVTFSQTDRNALVDVLNTQAMTRAQVLRVIAENQAFYNAEYNPAFVEMQYFGYLRRNPQDPPDNNLDGYNFWLNKLNQFGGDFRRAEMVKAFLVSGEYRQRFGPP